MKLGLMLNISSDEDDGIEGGQGAGANVYNKNFGNTSLSIS